MADAAEKTIAPTQPRRDDARREGRVAHSQDLAAAALLILGLLALSLLGEQIVSFLGQLTQRQLSSELLSTAAIDTSTSDTFDAIVDQGRSLVIEIITVLTPLLITVLAGAVAVNIAQTGFRWLPERLAPDLSRIDPLAGLLRIFSLGGSQRIVMGMLKLACVLVVGYISLWQRRVEITNIAALELPQLSAFVVEIAYWTSLKIAISLLVLAIGDYGYQRWKLERDLQMTPEELREEMRNQQGDPSTISRRRAMQKQQGVDRVAAAARQANIIVTAGRQLAVAIVYNPATMTAPIVVTKGTADVAESIQRTALQHNVPTVDRRPIAEALYRKTGFNQPISAELFDAVAEILAQIYRYNGQTLERRVA